MIHGLSDEGKARIERTTPRPAVTAEVAPKLHAAAPVPAAGVSVARLLAIVGAIFAFGAADSIAGAIRAYAPSASILQPAIATLR